MTDLEALLLRRLKLARDWVNEYAHLPHTHRCERMMEVGDPCSCTAIMSQRDLEKIDAAIRAATPVTSPEVAHGNDGKGPPEGGRVLPQDVARSGSELDRHGCGS